MKYCINRNCSVIRSIHIILFCLTKFVNSNFPSTLYFNRLTVPTNIRYSNRIKIVIELVYLPFVKMFYFYATLFSS